MYNDSIQRQRQHSNCTWGLLLYPIPCHVSGIVAGTSDLWVLQGRSSCSWSARLRHSHIPLNPELSNQSPSGAEMYGYAQCRAPCDAWRTVGAHRRSASTRFWESLEFRVYGVRVSHPTSMSSSCRMAKARAGAGSSLLSEMGDILASGCRAM